MEAVLIDKDSESINRLKSCLLDHDIRIIGVFSDPAEAQECILETRPSVVFLETCFEGQNGIELAKQIREAQPDIELIFVTEFPQFALEAYEAFPLDFLTKPIDEDRLSKTMTQLLRNLADRQALKKSFFYLRCFGKMKFYKGENIIGFPTQKTAELLAYILCHSDSPIYKDELMFSLFGDDTDERNINNMRVTLFRLRKTFEDAGLGREKLYITSNCSIQLKTGLCDLVDFSRFVSKNRNINDENILEALEIMARLNGELFSDLDNTWVNEKREWMNVEAEELLIKVSLYYLSKGKIAKAEETLLKLIGINFISEQAYQLLLDLYINTGDIQKFGFYYRRYERLMQEELRSFPDRKYLDYFTTRCL